MVENNNFIGSISFPLAYIYSSNTEFIVSPRVTFLPDSQGNGNGSGDFYGNNYGLDGLGLAVSE